MNRIPTNRMVEAAYRLGEALRLDEDGTKRRLDGYTRQCHRGWRPMVPTARQVRRIVKKARRTSARGR